MTDTLDPTGFTKLLVGDAVGVDSTVQPTLVNNQPVDAVAEFQSTTGMLLLPRMSTAQRTDPSLVLCNGMQVYDTTLNLFYGYTNGVWAALGAGGGGGVIDVTATLPVLSSGAPVPNISLAEQVDVEGAYLIPNVTVNEFGIITNIENGNAVTQLTQGANINLTPNVINGVGSIALATNVSGLISLSATTLVGGDIQIAGNSIVSTDMDGDILLDPNGDGDINLHAQGTGDINLFGQGAGSSINLGTFGAGNIDITTAGGTGGVAITSTNNASFSTLGSGILTVQSNAASIKLQNSVSVQASALELGTTGPDVPLRFYDTDSGNYVGFQAPDDIGGNVIWKLPEADGTGCLSSDGGGNLSWVPAAGTGTVTEITHDVSGNILFSTDPAPITTVGQISLNTALSGLTSVAVGGLNLSANSISSDSDININPHDTNSFIVQTTGLNGGISLSASGTGAIFVESLAGGIGLATSAPIDLSGSTVTVSGDGSTFVAPLQFYDLDYSNYVAFKPPATIPDDVTWTLPAADGLAGQVLSTTGTAGGSQLAWVTDSGGAVVSVATDNVNILGGPIDSTTPSGTISLNPVVSALDSVAATTVYAGNLTLSADSIASSGTSISIASSGATGDINMSALSGANITATTAGIGDVTFSLNGTGNFDVNTNGTGGISLNANDSGAVFITSGSGSVIVSSLTGAVSVITPHVELKTPGDELELRFYDHEAIPNYVGFKAPSPVSGAPGTGIIWTLPAADGLAGQVLSTTGTGGSSQLAWVSDASGTVTEITHDSSGNILFSTDPNPITTVGQISLNPALSGLTSVDVGNLLLENNQVRFYETLGDGFVAFQSPPSVGPDVVWILPAADGVGALTSDGAGQLSWTPEIPNPPYPPTYNNQLATAKYGYNQGSFGSGVGNFSKTMANESSAMFNLATFNPAAISFSGAVFDGKYIYFIPTGTNTLLTRYDTSSQNISPLAGQYETYDLGISGFAGGVFNGRYIYLAPNTTGTIVRYDTTLPFSNSASFDSFDLTTIDPTYVGFCGAVVDNYYVYFVPFGTIVTPATNLIRYYTKGAFNSPTSYAAFVTTSLSIHFSGCKGGIFDGQYIYYIPNVEYGLVRYDINGAGFTNTASYTLFDITPVVGGANEYSGACSDGRYIYFSPEVPYTHTVLRYDTTLPFTSTTSYTIFNPNAVAPGMDGFTGCVYDNRYVYFIPYSDGKVVRYDALLEFTDIASWSAYDATTFPVIGAGATAFMGGIFDGSHVYLVPGVHGILARLDAYTGNPLPTLLPASVGVASVPSTADIVSGGGPNPLLNLATSPVIPGSVRAGFGFTVNSKGIVTGTTANDIEISGHTIKTNATPTPNLPIVLSANGTGSININNGVAPTELRFYEGANWVGFKAPALSSNFVWELPPVDGTAGQFLTTDNAGSLYFSSGVAGTVTNVSGTAPIVSTGGPTPAISISDTGTAGTYTYPSSVTTDAKGRVSAITSAAQPPVTSVSGTAFNIISTGGTNPVLDLIDAGTGGTYAYPSSITTDGKGRVTAASAGSAPVTSVIAGTNIAVSGTTIATISLATTVTGLTALTSGTLNAANLTLNGNTLSTTNMNGALVLAPDGTGHVRLGSASSNTPALRFYNGLTNYVSFQAGSLSGISSYTWPLSDSAGFLQSNGSGILSWGAAGTGSVTSVATGTGLTGGPITTTGTISLANISGVSGTHPYPVTIDVNGQGQITAITDGSAPVLLSGSTMTGNLILNADPTSSLQAVTKQYVDAIAAGISVRTSCYAATTGNFNAVYLNGTAGVGATLVAVSTGAFTVDGTSPPINSRIMVKDQSTTFQNGVYTLTTVGGIGVSAVLTRATDYNQTAEIIPGSLFPIDNGTVNAVSSWIETATVVTIGTDPILFSKFSASGSVTSVDTGAGLTGGPITSSGTISMPNVGPNTTAAFATVTTDAQGRVTALTAGTPVTSVSAGTNIAVTGTTAVPIVSLSATPSGITSIGVGNLTLSGSTLTSTGTLIVSSGGTNTNLDLTPAGTGLIRLINASGPAKLVFPAFTSGGVVGFQAASSFSGTTIWQLPTVDAAGFLQSNGSNILSFATAVTSVTAGTNIAVTGTATVPIVSLSATPSGLTSLGVTNLTLTSSTSTIANVAAAALIITSTATNRGIILSPNGTGSVSIQSNGSANPVPLRLYEGNLGSNFVAFQAGVLTTDTTWTLPLADGTSGQFLQTAGTAGSNALTFADAVTSVTAGTGLSGGTITTTGTISMPNVGTASTVAFATVTTDAQGRVTTLVAGNPVTSVIAGTNIGVSGTTTPTVSLSATPSGLTSLGVTNLTLTSSTSTIANIAAADMVITSTATDKGIVLSPNGAGTVSIKSNGTATAVALNFYNPAGTFFFGMKAPVLTATGRIFTWPLGGSGNGDGTSGQFLQTNGSGTLTWASGNVGTVTSVTAGSANITVATGTTTPVIDLATTITGLTALTSTTLTAGNLSLNTNTIASASNTNIILNPGGTGQVNFPDLAVSSVLYLNASGNLTAQALTSGQLMIGSTGANPSFNTLTGTTNQITVTPGAGSITLSLPQSIATSSSPTFSGITLTTANIGNLAVSGGTITNATGDTTITSTNTNAGVILSANGLGTVSIGNNNPAVSATLRLYEASNNGLNYVAFKAGTALPGDVTWTLPLTDSTGTQFLRSDGAGTLSWATGNSGTVTAVTGTASNISSTGGTTPQIDLINAGTAGTYTFVSSMTTDAKGRVTAAVSGTAPVTSVIAGTNIGVSGTTTPTVSLVAAPTGLTSLGVTNLTLTSSTSTIANVAAADMTITSTATNQGIVLSPNGAGTVSIKSNGTATAVALNFYNPANTFFFGMKAPVLTVTGRIFTWPLGSGNGDGTSGQFLQTDGSGTLTWASGNAGTVTSITAGTNLTGGTITSTGTIALSATPSGLTSIGISGASNQIVLSSSVSQLTLNSSTSAAARTYTVPDVGATSNFLMATGTQTVTALALTGVMSFNVAANANNTSIGTGSNTGTVAIGNASSTAVTVLGTTSINASNNAVTNINTGTTTSAVNIGSVNVTSLNLASAAVNLTGTAVNTTGITNLNASANFATNINTGTSTGATTIGNSLSSFVLKGDVNINAVAAANTNIAGTSNTGTVTIGNASATAVNLLGTAISTTGVTNINVGANFATNINTGANNAAINIGNATASAVAILGPTNINVSSNDITNINTGTTTSAVNIGSVNVTSLNLASAAVNLTGTAINNTGVTNINASANFDTNINTGTSANSTNIGNSLSSFVLKGDVNINNVAAANTNIAATSNTGTVTIGNTLATAVNIIGVAASIKGTTSINASNNAVTNINTGTTTSAVNIGNASVTSLNMLGTAINTTGVTNLNASANFATNVNTGTSTGTVTLGNTLATAVNIIGVAASIKGTTSINASNNAVTNINTGTTTSAVNIGNASVTSVNLLGTAINNTGVTNINASANFATNINTGTSTGTVTIGNSSNTVSIPTSASITTVGATTVNATTVNPGTLNVGTFTMSSSTMISNTANADMIFAPNGSGKFQVNGDTLLNVSQNFNVKLNTGTSTGTTTIGNSLSTLNVLTDLNLTGNYIQTGITSGYTGSSLHKGQVGVQAPASTSSVTLLSIAVPTSPIGTSINLRILLAASRNASNTWGGAASSVFSGCQLNTGFQQIPGGGIPITFDQTSGSNTLFWYTSGNNVVLATTVTSTFAINFVISYEYFFSSSSTA